MVVFNDGANIPVWARENVEMVVDEEIFKGNDDGTFKPMAELNRAEALVLLFRMNGISFNKTQGTSIFKDVPDGAWYTSAVVEATQRGWAKGDPDGNFRPYGKVNKAEWATFITRAFGLKKDPDYLPNYDDVDTDDWYYEPVAAIYAYNLNRVRARKFEPEKKVTRVEAAWMLGELLKYNHAMEEAQKVAEDATTKMKEQQDKLKMFGEKLDSRRVGYKPIDFDANNQVYEVEKEQVWYSVDPEEISLFLNRSSDRQFLVSILVENNMEDRVELSSLDFRLRFDKTNAGPASEFMYKIVKDGEVLKEDYFSSNGGMFLGSIGTTLDSGEMTDFRISIKPDSGGNFYATRGEGTLSFLSGEAMIIGAGKDGRFAPVSVLTNRDFATFVFLP